MILPGMILPSLCLCGAAKRINGVRATKESRRLDLRFAISDLPSLRHLSARRC
jgi:hypothetical protein